MNPQPMTNIKIKTIIFCIPIELPWSDNPITRMYLSDEDTMLNDIGIMGTEWGMTNTGSFMIKKGDEIVTIPQTLFYGHGFVAADQGRVITLDRPPIKPI